MQIIAVFHSYNSLVGLLAPFEVCMVHSGPMKTSLREEGSKSVPAHGLFGPVSEVHGVFSNGDLTVYSGATRGNRHARHKALLCVDEGLQKLSDSLLSSWTQ